LKKQSTSMGMSKWEYFYVEAYSRTVKIMYKLVIIENEIAKVAPQGMEFL
jgi:hypothetical protein